MKVRDLRNLFFQFFIVFIPELSLFVVGHGDIEGLGFLILFPGQKHRRMFLGRVSTALTSGVTANSSHCRQGAFDHRTDLRQGADQLFLFLSYRHIVFHTAILYKYNMILSRDEWLKECSDEIYLRSL